MASVLHLLFKILIIKSVLGHNSSSCDIFIPACMVNENNQPCSCDSKENAYKMNQCQNQTVGDLGHLEIFDRKSKTKICLSDKIFSLGRRLNGTRKFTNYDFVKESHRKTREKHETNLTELMEKCMEPCPSLRNCSQISEFIYMFKELKRILMNHPDYQTDSKQYPNEPTYGKSTTPSASKTEPSTIPANLDSTSPHQGYPISTNNGRKCQSETMFWILILLNVLQFIILGSLVISKLIKKGKNRGKGESAVVLYDDCLTTTSNLTTLQTVTFPADKQEAVLQPEGEKQEQEAGPVDTSYNYVYDHVAAVEQKAGKQASAIYTSIHCTPTSSFYVELNNKLQLRSNRR